MSKVLLPTRMGLGMGISSSARRYFVDRFYDSYSEEFSRAKSILDVGGTRDKKRGQFDISKHSQNVMVLNIDDGKGADIVCNASSMPIADATYDIIICAEVLEHVESPEKVLSEISRVCAEGGYIYLTAPFLFPVHADPYDFRRFTSACWQKMIADAGLEVVKIQPQGNFYTVLADMLRMWVYKKVKNKLLRFGLYVVLRPFITWSIKAADSHVDEFTVSFTSGYGVVARKPLNTG